MPTGIYNHPTGEDHPQWKGGKPKCLRCNKILYHYETKRCKKCANTKENHPSWKGGFPKCIDCNIGLHSYIAKRCLECRGLYLSGVNHYGWKGGKTRPLKLIRKKGKYYQWRKKVFDRDRYTCQKCGRVGGYLQADHVIPVSLCKDLCYNLENGKTLCLPCHKQKTKIDYQLGFIKK